MRSWIIKRDLQVRVEVVAPATRSFMEKKIYTLSIKTSYETLEVLQELRKTFDPPRTMSQIGHMAIRHGIKSIKKIRDDARSIGDLKTA